MPRILSPTSLALIASLLLPCTPLAAQKTKKDKKDNPTQAAQSVIWSQPDNISARDTFNGPGGGTDLPAAPVQFLEEDMAGSNPKFDVRTPDGTKWKVKLGDETRPEAAADHLLWAVGYYTTEDYFVPLLHVEGLPAHLKRGQNLVGPGDEVHNVRIKRMDGKKLGEWKWKDNPFTGTREFNGLRAMMSLMNNWDLMDVNNAIYDVKGDPPLNVYLVTDLGASFGTTGQSYSGRISKGNEKNYVRSTFITKVTPTTVSFKTPTLPPIPVMLFFVNEIHPRIDMEWIKRDVPRADVAWVGSLLAQLTPQQLTDVFRAAGFTPDQVDGYVSCLQTRIDALNHLDDYPSAAGSNR